MLPLSLIIPHIDIELISINPISNAAIPLFFDDFGSIGDYATQTNVVNDSIWNFGSFLGLLYCFGVLLSLIKLTMNGLKIISIKRQSTTSTDREFFIISANVPLVFSCFKWIFVPLNDKNSINSSIIAHEKLHGKARHTLDLIATELYVALLWFNPFVYLFRRDLKAVHEFQVDSMLLQSDIKKSDYLQLMLNNLVSPHRVVGLYNYFSGLTINKRVKMITKNKSSKWQLLRYLLIVPAIAIMTISFTNSTNKGGDVPSISPIKMGDYDRIASTYGMRMHPIDKVEKLHSGIDFAAKKGTSIMATADGMVIKVEHSKKGYGKMIIINHGGRYETWYTQIKDYAVKEGEKVSRGEVIGYVGSSGRSTGPHLHYEVRKDGKPVNPQDYIKD